MSNTASVQHLDNETCDCSPQEMDQKLKSAGIYEGDGSPSTSTTEAMGAVYSLSAKLLQSNTEVWEWGLNVREDEKYEQMGGRWGGSLRFNGKKFEAYTGSKEMSICCVLLLFEKYVD